MVAQPCIFITLPKTSKDLNRMFCSLLHALAKTVIEMAHIPYVSIVSYLVWSEEVSVVWGDFTLLVFLLPHSGWVNAIYSLAYTQTQIQVLVCVCSTPFLANGYGMEWNGKSIRKFRCVRARKMLCQFDFSSFRLLTFWPLPLNN